MAVPPWSGKVGLVQSEDLMFTFVAADWVNSALGWARCAQFAGRAPSRDLPVPSPLTALLSTAASRPDRQPLPLQLRQAPIAARVCPQVV